MPNYVVVEGHTVSYENTTYQGGDKLTAPKQLGDALTAAGHVVAGATQQGKQARSRRSAWTPNDADEDDDSEES